MLFRKVRDFIKVSFNCDKKLYDKLEYIKDVYFCNTTDIINQALREYIERFEKKKSRLDKINDK